MIADLIRRQAARPRTLKTLRGTIDGLFQKRLNSEEINAILEELTKRGVVKVSEGKLSYDLPKKP